MFGTEINFLMVTVLHVIVSRNIFLPCFNPAWLHPLTEGRGMKR